MTRRKRAAWHRHSCALVAVLAAMIASRRPAAAQGPNDAALSGYVGGWAVAVWVADGEVSYGLTREGATRGQHLRVACSSDGSWSLGVLADTGDYGWPRWSNSRADTVWVSYDGGQAERVPMRIDTYGGVFRGIIGTLDPWEVFAGDTAEWQYGGAIWSSRTVSFATEAPSGGRFDDFARRGRGTLMEFNVAGLHDAHRLAYTVTGLCRPSGP